MERRPEAERPRARSADVLGISNDRDRIDPKWREHFDQLTDFRERLLARRGDLGRLSAVDEATFAVNPADRATDEYEAEATASQSSSNQEALYEIEQALQRIRDGTYGICEATGEPIPEDRLTAVPWTRFARQVEDDVERERASRKPRHVL
jgi:RNA polymerase-binding transcription factor DksA